MSIRAVASTMGHANPSQVTLTKPYRYQGIKDWTPGANLPEPEPEPEPEGLRAGHMPASHFNSPSSVARRFRKFCASMENNTAEVPEHVKVRQAGIAAGVTIKTARRYNAQRKAALQEQQRGEVT